MKKMTIIVGGLLLASQAAWAHGNHQAFATAAEHSQWHKTHKESTSWTPAHANHQTNHMKNSGNTHNNITSPMHGF